MKLEMLQIHTIKGVRENDRFTIDGLAEGINIVQGPNGVGKTTICRAVDSILRRNPDPEARLASKWKDGTEEWRSDVANGKNVWLRNGQKVDRPPIDEEQYLRPCVIIRVDEIWKDGDDTIAGAFAREMAGGFVLDEVSKQAGLVEPTSAKLGNRNREFQKLSATKEIAERVVDDLAQQELGLRALEARRAELAQKADEKPVNDAAIVLAEKVRKLFELAVQMDGYPAEMDRLENKDNETLDKLLEERAAIAQAIQDTRTRLQQAQQGVESCGLPDDAEISGALLTEWEDRLRSLSDIEREIQEQVRARENAAVQQTEASRMLAPSLPPDRALNVRTRDVEQAEECVRESSRIKAVSDGLERAKREVACPDPAIGSPALQQGIALLTEWLSAPNSVPAPNVRPTLPQIVVLAIVAVLGIVAAVQLKQPWPAAITVLVGIALFLAFTSKAVAGVNGETMRPELRQQFEQKGVVVPKTWDRAGVKNRVEEINVEIAIALKAEKLKEVSVRIDSEAAALATERQNNEKTWERLRTQTNLPLEDITVTAIWLMRNLSAYAQASLDHAEAVAAVQTRQTEGESLLGYLNGSMRDYLPGTSLSADGVAARARFEDLKLRSSKIKVALAERTREQTSIKDYERQSTEKEERIAGFFRDRGVSDDREFHERFAHLEDWKTLAKLMNDTGVEANLKRAELSGHPELLEMAERASDASQSDTVARRLAALLVAADAAVRDATDTADEITGIRVRVLDAEKSANVSEATAAVERERDRLTAERADALAAFGWSFLKPRIEAAQLEQQPETLKRARRYFSAFTKGAFELRIESKSVPPKYLAYRSSDGTASDVTELSGGERIQLLLAARLAYSEGSEDLPLFLDEILAHCDEDRYNAIVDTLATLVKEDRRQVFYLTSNRSDYARIADRFKAAGLPDPHEVNLHEIRRGEHAWPRGWEFLISTPTPAPDPSGMTPDQYRSLIEAARFDPFQGIGRVDLFYPLLEDMEAVRLLRDSGIDTCGQWTSYPHEHRQAIGLDADQVRGVDAGIAIVSSFREAWSFGRGRPLDTAAVHNSGVTPTFRDKVVDIAQQCQWDAAALMRELARRPPKLSGFQDQIRIRMKTYFLENDFLVEGELLTESEIVERVIAGCAGGGLPVSQIRSHAMALYRYATGPSETAV